MRVQAETHSEGYFKIDAGQSIDFTNDKYVDPGTTISFHLLVEAPNTNQIMVYIVDAPGFVDFIMGVPNASYYETWAVTGELTTYTMQTPYRENWRVIITNTDRYDDAYIFGSVSIGDDTYSIETVVPEGPLPLLVIFVVIGSFIAILVVVFLVRKRKVQPTSFDEGELLETGILQLSLGRYDEAQLTFGSILEKNAKSAIAWRYRGDIHVLRGDIPMARAAHKIATTLDPSYRVSSRIKSKTKVTGEPWKESVIEMDLTMSVQALTKPLPFGIMGADAKLFEQTLEQQQEKLQENPDDSELLKEVAETLFLLGRYRESAEMYGKALAKTPDDWKIHDSLLMALGGAKY
jgi:tetratricopeptide (TPR) repeat protein